LDAEFDFRDFSAASPAIRCVVSRSTIRARTHQEGASGIQGKPNGTPSIPSINGAQRRRHNARHRTASAATTHLSFLQENVMSDPTRLYEPLTSENAALILIDHQVGLMTGFAITRREN